MRIDIPRSATPFFNEKQRLFTENQSALQAWIHRPFSEDAILEQLKEKQAQFSTTQRYILAEGLEESYAESTISEKYKRI